MKSVVNFIVHNNNDWEKLLENTGPSFISPSRFLSINKEIKLLFFVKDKIALDKKWQLLFLKKRGDKKLSENVLPYQYVQCS